jgi:hypothetical protein
MDLLVVWLLFGIVSAIIGSSKGRNGCSWFLLGVLLGPFGLILSLVVSKNQSAIEEKMLKDRKAKKCFHCAELIKIEAIKCHFCGEEA